jgi:hypothetical protein
MENKEGKKILNQEILGGLKAAIARGSSLKDAMMSFYQAGYDKTEIEESAKVYVELQKSPEELIKKREENTKEEEKRKENGKVYAAPLHSEKEKKSQEVIEKPKVIQPSKSKVVQRVSNYDFPEKPKPPRGKALTFVLIFMLLFLLGALATVILFKDELVNFFNGLFT